MTTPLHCKVCAKPLHGQQRLYCGRPCKRRAYAAKQKLREVQDTLSGIETLVARDDSLGERLLSNIGYDPLVYDRRWAAQIDTQGISVTRTSNSITVIAPPNTTAADVAAHPDIAPYMAPAALTLPTPKQPSLPRRLYAYIQLLGHTLYHVFDGWRTK